MPWAFMLPHESQCQRNHQQSLKRIAERGGFSPSEAWCCVNGLRLWPVHDSDVSIETAKKNWFDLADRINKEWAFKELMVVHAPPPEFFRHVPEEFMFNRELWHMYRTATRLEGPHVIIAIERHGGELHVRGRKIKDEEGNQGEPLVYWFKEFEK